MNTLFTFIKRDAFSIVVALLYLFLYLPILLLVIFSFNKNPYDFFWTGFSTQWYVQVFKSSEIGNALKNSIIVALSASVLSVLMGTLFVSFGSGVVVKRMQMFFYAILAMPEIVLAVSMLNLFSLFGVSLGFTTLIVGHTLLGLGYVVPIVYTRFVELDKRLLEAAYDLGATREQMIRTIILPLLRPALLSAGMLTFMVSFDDFIFSFFCASGNAQTLPVYLFAVIKSGTSPAIAAFSTLLLIVSSLFIGIFSFIQFKKIGSIL